jgi:hypothetical protein
LREKKKNPIRNFKDCNELFKKFKYNFWKIKIFNKTHFSNTNHYILKKKKTKNKKQKSFKNLFSLFQAWTLVLIYMEKKKKRSNDLLPWLEAAPLKEAQIETHPLRYTCRVVVGGGTPPPSPLPF